MMSILQLKQSKNFFMEEVHLKKKTEIIIKKYYFSFGNE